MKLLTLLKDISICVSPLNLYLALAFPSVLGDDNMATRASSIEVTTWKKNNG